MHRPPPTADLHACAPDGVAPTASRAPHAARLHAVRPAGAGATGAASRAESTLRRIALVQGAGA